MTNGPAAVFLLDANVFIEAHRRYYALDLCPGFWECVVNYCQETRMLSIDRVRDKIAGGDALSAWAKQAPDELFASSAQQSVADKFGEMMAWVQANDQFLTAAKAEFARVADGWLAAYAQVHGMVLVTHEEYAPNVRKKVPLPDVCRQFAVPYTDTFAMLRALEVRFGWVR